MESSVKNFDTIKYDNEIVRNFALITVIWGIVGMLVGVIVALQIFIPEANLGILTFGRLRPLHTNAVIFAFVGNAIFTGVYYSLPRLAKAPMWSRLLSRIHFWGWQLIIVSAAITFPLGITTSKEYAELEWPIDLAIAVVWVIFGINMIMTLVKRREKHMYVAIWFYLASWVAVTILHVFNSLEIPVTLFKSYPVYAGVQDALVQWWYGHNAVAFFLTTPFLGLMYYFLPKASERPIYSYKLSIIHFWSLIFIYMWAGPHHLLYSSLPDWAQSLGTVFSIMLIAPSWGGMLNGLLTLRGAWDKVREEPILKFMVVAITAYGMSTFEGPMMSIKSVNALSHFTDWTIGHVHIGGLGWNGMLTFGMLYWLVPKLFKTELFSKKLANTHFWISFIGIIVYVIPLYFAGITQGLMWKQFDAEGFLVYKNFLETVTHLIPMYAIRSIGGTLYLTGAILGLYNLLVTMKRGTFDKEETVNVPVRNWDNKLSFNHRWLEGKPIPFLILTFVAVFIGGVLEIVPTIMIKSNIPTIASVRPYTPLELQGRDIYIREGCYTCHSQQVRPFRDETVRYGGEYSKAGEYVYDFPFQWGSKRTGPDLHRVGAKYPNLWHFNHMIDPRAVSPGSIMPSYRFMATANLDTSKTAAKIRAMQFLGVPYPDGYDKYANQDLMTQALKITDNLRENGIETPPNKELIALIAYLQRLGTDIKGNEVSFEMIKEMK